MLYLLPLNYLCLPSYPPFKSSIIMAVIKMPSQVCVSCSFPLPFLCDFCCHFMPIIIWVGSYLFWLKGAIIYSQQRWKFSKLPVTWYKTDRHSYLYNYLTWTTHFYIWKASGYHFLYKTRSSSTNQNTKSNYSIFVIWHSMYYTIQSTIYGRAILFALLPSCIVVCDCD